MKNTGIVQTNVGMYKLLAGHIDLPVFVLLPVRIITGLSTFGGQHGVIHSLAPLGVN